MPRKLARYCSNGHDTFVTGRYASRRCKVCVKGRYGKRVRYLPAEPLRAYVRQYALRYMDPFIAGSQGLNELSRLYGHRHGLDRWAAEAAIRRLMYKGSPGITEETADRWCIALGIHPIELWPEEWPLVDA